MAESQDPYRRMIEKPGFGRRSTLTGELLRLVQEHPLERPEKEKSRIITTPELMVVHGLASAYTELTCARYDIPDQGRTTMSNPEPAVVTRSFTPMKNFREAA